MVSKFSTYLTIKIYFNAYTSPWDEKVAKNCLLCIRLPSLGDYVAYTSDKGRVNALKIVCIISQYLCSFKIIKPILYIYFFSKSCTLIKIHLFCYGSQCSGPHFTYKLQRNLSQVSAWQSGQLSKMGEVWVIRIEFIHSWLSDIT